MKGFGEKCPGCGLELKIERRLRYAPDKQVGVLGCFECEIYWRVDIMLKPIRSYQRVIAKNPKEGTPPLSSRQQAHDLPLYGREVADGLFGLGECCPHCGDNMRVRTSRRVKPNYKIFYLKCVGFTCKSGLRVDVIFYKDDNF